MSSVSLAIHMKEGIKLLPHSNIMFSLLLLYRYLQILRNKSYKTPWNASLYSTCLYDKYWTNNVTNWKGRRKVLWITSIS